MSDKTKLQTLLGALDKAAIAVACVALIAMAGVEAWQVFARYVLNDSPSWTEPVALLCMSTTMMFGAAAGVRAGRHFGFFILAHSVAPPLRWLLHVLARAISAALGIMLALWSAELLANAWDYRIAGAPLPQGVVFLPICLGGVLIAIFSIEQLFARQIVTDHE